MIGRMTCLLVLLSAFGLVAAGCGGDDESGGNATRPANPGDEEEAALQEQIADLSVEEQIERVGEAWAEPFGKGDEAMCAYLHPSLGGHETCISAGYVEGALTQSTKVQQSFEGATVRSVDMRGNTAVATFSNGERVGFKQGGEGHWKVAEVSGK